jgi:hypothetical protein
MKTRAPARPGDDEGARGPRGQMEMYRFFGVNERDTVIHAEEIQCENDSSARAVARTKVTDQLGVEVWDAGRRICKLQARTGSF